MRLLYGVVGEGMGHATRSRVVIEHLLAQGHQVRIVVSGRAHAFLTKAFGAHPQVTIHEIHGFTFTFDGPTIDLLATIVDNVKKGVPGLVKNLDLYAEIVENGFQPEAVISDFESWAYLYGRTHQLPVISIDNMQILNRCANPDATTAFKSFDFQLAKTAVKAKLPGAWHYLVTTFFTPPVRKPRTTLVPPILRPAILAAERARGDHVLVYQTAAASGDALVPMLKSLPHKFRVYGLGREGHDENLEFRPFSETGFVDDLRSARAVIANGGLSLMAEAVHLHVPMLSIPVAGNYEQSLNARWLEHLGWGMFADRFDRDLAGVFLDHTARFEAAMADWVPRDNSMLFGCVDELLDDVAHGRDRADRLKADALGKYGDPSTDA